MYVFKNTWDISRALIINHGFFTCLLIFLGEVRTLMIFMSWEGQVNKNINFNSYTKMHSCLEYRNRKASNHCCTPERQQKECQIYNFSDALWYISVFAYMFIYILVLIFVLNRGKLPRPLACQPASISQHP